MVSLCTVVPILYLLFLTLSCDLPGMHVKVGELMSILKTATIPDIGHGRPAPGPRRPSPPPPPRAAGAYFLAFDQRANLDPDK